MSRRAEIAAWGVGLALVSIAALGALGYAWWKSDANARVERLASRSGETRRTLDRLAPRRDERMPTPVLPSSDPPWFGRSAMLESFEAHLERGTPLSAPAERKLANLESFLAPVVGGLPAVGDRDAPIVAWGDDWPVVAAWVGRLPPERCVEGYARLLDSVARVVAERVDLPSSIQRLETFLETTWRVPVRCAVEAEALPPGHRRAWRALASLDVEAAVLLERASVRSRHAAITLGALRSCIADGLRARGDECELAEAQARRELDEADRFLAAIEAPTTRRSGQMQSREAEMIATMLIASDAAQRVAVLGCDGIRDLRHPLPGGALECDDDTLVMRPGVDGADELRLHVPDDVPAPATANTRERADAAMTIRAALGTRRDAIDAAWGAPVDTIGAFVDYGRGRRLRYRADVAIEARASARERGEVSLEEWLGIPTDTLDACTRTREGSCAFELDDVHGERRADVYRLWPRPRDATP